jgi:hypothetical protein
VSNNINGHDYLTPPTVPATQVLLEMLADSPEFAIVEDFHPGVNESITLVHHGTHSAVTLVIFESFEKTAEPDRPWPLRPKQEKVIYADARSRFHSVDENHNPLICSVAPDDPCQCTCEDCKDCVHVEGWYHRS